MTWRTGAPTSSASCTAPSAPASTSSPPGLSEAEVDAWTVAHGFDVDDLDLRPSTGPVHAYLALTDAWRAELPPPRRGRPMTRPARQQLIDLLEQAGTDPMARRVIRALRRPSPPGWMRWKS